MAFINVPRSSSSKVQRDGRPYIHFYFTLYSSIPLKERISHHVCIFPWTLQRRQFPMKSLISQKTTTILEREKKEGTLTQESRPPHYLGSPSLPSAPTQHREFSEHQRQGFPLSVFRFNWALSKCCCERETLFISARAAKNEPEKLYACIFGDTPN